MFTLDTYIEWGTRNMQIYYYLLNKKNGNCIYNAINSSVANAANL